MQRIKHVTANRRTRCVTFCQEIRKYISMRNEHPFDCPYYIDRLIIDAFLNKIANVPISKWYFSPNCAPLMLY